MESVFRRVSGWAIGATTPGSIPRRWDAGFGTCFTMREKNCRQLNLITAQVALAALPLVFWTIPLLNPYRGAREQIEKSIAINLPLVRATTLRFTFYLSLLSS